MRSIIRLACLLSAALGLSACAPMLAVMGSSPGLVQVITQIERVKLLADGASYASSNKTLADHALSNVVGKECKIFNLITKESVCADAATVVAADSDVQPKDGADGDTSAARRAQATAQPRAPAIVVSSDHAAGE